MPRSLGVRFIYDAPVERIEQDGKRATGVVLKDGRKLEADVIVVNADLPYAYRELLKDEREAKKLDKKKFTCSAIMFYWGVDKVYPQTNSENEQLKKQISVLQKLPDNVKGENLYKLENVKIHNYSALYDENKDGKLDTLIVRIQPVDNHGDTIKAAGNVEIELWNLNKPEGQAQIGKWQVGLEELKKTWNNTLVANYRLTFDISGKIDKLVEPLTLKMIFTDYLTGKTFQGQKVIEP